MEEVYAAVVGSHNGDTGIRKRMGGGGEVAIYIKWLIKVAIYIKW